MKRSNSTRALAAQHVLVAFFLAAGCQAAVDDAEAEADPTEEEYFESRDDLDCELQLECGELSSADQCTMGSGLSECSEFNAVDAGECLKAMEELLEAVEGDAGICSGIVRPEECANVVIFNDAECGTTAGRPLFVDGQQILPSVLPPCARGVGPSAQAAEHWLECARMESASVPAFTRLAAELASVGAPGSMTEAAEDAAADEIRHTQLCLDAAERLVDTEFAVGLLPEVPARPGITIGQLAAEALIEGCIGEGSAAAWATLASNRARPEFASTLRDIAADELRHAALSWRVIGWALRRQPSLGPRLLAALDAWQQDEASTAIANERTGLASMGVLSTADERAAARELVSVVVRPTLQALCRRTVGTALRV